MGRVQNAVIPEAGRGFKANTGERMEENKRTSYRMAARLALQPVQAAGTVRFE
jgi:hypothetical protein